LFKIQIFIFKNFLNKIKKFLGGNRRARGKTTRKTSRWTGQEAQSTGVDSARTAAGLASLESSIHFVTAAEALVQARLAGHFSSSSSTSLLHAPGEEKSAVPRN